MSDVTQTSELLWSLKAALEWIDALPEDLVLPAMPGFDRDYVDALIDVVEKKS